jgi:hypothetical protein
MKPFPPKGKGLYQIHTEMMCLSLCHKTVHHALFARMVKIDIKLVPVNMNDCAIAELVMEHTVFHAKDFTI